MELLYVQLNPRKSAYQSITQLSNDELRAKTEEFKQRIADGIAEDDKEIATISTPDPAALHRTMKNNIFGLSEDLRLKQLTSENQSLKKLVEDLMHDKLSQAQRIMELNEEKSRFKETIADLILDKQN